MEGVGIYDRITLGDILGALGSRGERTCWRPRTKITYVSGDDGPVTALESDDAGGPWTSTGQFGQLETVLRQIIDGVLEGTERTTVSARDRQPWVVLRAVDSSWWEVYTEDPSILATLRRQFRDVRPARYSPGHPATDYGA